MTDISNRHGEKPQDTGQVLKSMIADWNKQLGPGTGNLPSIQVSVRVAQAVQEKLQPYKTAMRVSAADAKDIHEQIERHSKELARGWRPFNLEGCMAWASAFLIIELITMRFLLIAQGERIEALERKDRKRKS